MKKIFFSIIFLFLFLNSLESETIDNIKIEGNERISDETIILFGNIELNKDYSSNDLNEILKQLYSTDFFKKVEINIKNKNLNIFIEENPIIQNLVINGVRSKKYNELINKEKVEISLDDAELILSGKTLIKTRLFSKKYIMCCTNPL